MSRYVAFRWSGGRWLAGTTHDALTGPGGAHGEVGGGRAHPPPGAGEIVATETGLPVYRTGVAGAGAGEWGLGSSCVPEPLRRAAGLPIREAALWSDPTEHDERGHLPRDADLAAIFGVEIER